MLAVFVTLLLLQVASGTFTVTDEVWAPGTKHQVDLKVLSNTATGELLKVIVSPGGRVEQLLLRDKDSNVLRDVLQGHSNNATAVWDNLHWRGAMLAPFANRIANGTYSFDGTKYYLPRNEEPARECALHGFLYDKPLTIESQTTSDAAASLTLSHVFGTDPGFPFRVRIAITYTLMAKSINASEVRFDVEATNTATDGTESPFFFGMHPYFKVRDVSTAHVVLDRRAAEYLQVLMPAGAPRDGTLIPTLRTAPWSSFNGTDPIGGTSDQPTYYDHEFKAARAAEVMNTLIRDEDGGAVLWQDSSFRFNQIFTGSREKWGDQSIAFEPMSAKADAYNNHDQLTILSAGQTWHGSYGIYAATSFA